MDKPSAADPNDPHSHRTRCIRAIEGYADDLVERVEEDRAEILIKSFLEQPAFWPEWRRELLDIGMRRFRS